MGHKPALLFLPGVRPDWGQIQRGILEPALPACSRKHYACDDDINVCIRACFCLGTCTLTGCVGAFTRLRPHARVDGSRWN